jgi:hypothetical protein
MDLNKLPKDIKDLLIATYYLGYRDKVNQKPPFNRGDNLQYIQENLFPSNEQELERISSVS